MTTQSPEQEWPSWAAEVEDEEEGGQPNGAGEIEPSDFREWFTDERESHHRRKVTLYGPWEEGPTQWAKTVQESRRLARERQAARDLANERAEYERLKAKYGPPRLRDAERGMSP